LPIADCRLPSAVSRFIRRGGPIADCRFTIAILTARFGSSQFIF
jgi:hypothetical protein